MIKKLQTQVDTKLNAVNQARRDLQDIHYKVRTGSLKSVSAVTKMQTKLQKVLKKGQADLAAAGVDLGTLLNLRFNEETEIKKKADEKKAAAAEEKLKKAAEKERLKGLSKKDIQLLSNAGYIGGVGELVPLTNKDLKTQLKKLKALAVKEATKKTKKSPVPKKAAKVQAIAAYPFPAAKPGDEDYVAPVPKKAAKRIHIVEHAADLAQKV